MDGKFAVETFIVKIPVVSSLVTSTEPARKLAGARLSVVIVEFDRVLRMKWVAFDFSWQEST